MARPFIAAGPAHLSSEQVGSQHTRSGTRRSVYKVDQQIFDPDHWHGRDGVRAGQRGGRKLACG
eukprot:3928334-Lingulodinium_polyedra.AAC.1